MERLPDFVLLKIFSYFHIEELVGMSRVNSEWQRVAFDWYLWQEVSLEKYNKRMTDLTLRKLIRNIFPGKLRYLDLTRFNATSGTLHVLRKTCPRLKTLILEYANFYESYKEFPDIEYFPRNLKEVNIAYSTGPASIYRNFMKCLETDSLESLNVCDPLLELFSENKSNFINFFLRQRLSLKVLKFSFCERLGDEVLRQITLCCRNLNSLCVSRCRNMAGEFLNSISDICPYLRSFILNGAMVSNGVFMNINWSRCLLVELDLSWCRHISEEGLLYTLPAVNLCLRYLHVSCCGYGHALTNKVLEAMAQKSWKFLHILDVRYSYEITDKGLDGLLQKCQNLSKLRKSNCPNLTLDKL